MSIEKMTLVNIYGDRKKLDEVILKCSDYNNFHPQPAVVYSEKVKGFAPLTEENPYTALLKKIMEIADATSLDLKYEQDREHSLETQKADQFLDEFQQKLLGLNARRDSLCETIQSQSDALGHLKHIEGLDISLDDIFLSKFLEVRFGRLPADSFKKLNYYSDRLFIYISLDTDQNYNWGVYVTTQEEAPEIDHIFASLYFERIWIPDYIHGTPDFARSSLQAQIDSEKAQLDMVNAELTDLVTSNKFEFYHIYSRVKFLNASFEMRKYVSVTGDMLHIVGFVPTAEAKQFMDNFSAIEGVTVEPIPVDADSHLTPPTKLKNNFIVKPFEMFVEMYGLPGYNDIDPTPFVAITFCLLFGVMFGDVGQGLLISLIGSILWKWKGMRLGQVMNRIGFSSCFFGFVYGSVFGYEEFLTPFYTGVLGLSGKPIHVMHPSSTNTILGCAVALGAVIIVISMGINIIIGFKKKDYGRAIFSHNGIAGLVFYGSIIVVVVARLFFNTNLLKPAFTLPCMALPLVFIFFKEPLTRLIKGHKEGLFHEGFGSFFTESFFELFEVLLSFVTNTMSFLRVGGFALSHAGMMAVVFTLAEMVNPVAYPIVIIGGNLFIMCMEGLIVGIQVLRLEFYEMFSRYYDGEGLPFVPIAVRLKAE